MIFSTTALCWLLRLARLTLNTESEHAQWLQGLVERLTQVIEDQVVIFPLFVPQFKSIGIFFL